MRRLSQGWEKAATSGTSASGETRNCFVTSNFHLYRCTSRIPTKRSSGVTSVAKGYCSGVPRTWIFLTSRVHDTETIQRYFTKAVAIPISPNQDDIKNYLEMPHRDDQPEAMNND